MQFLKLCCWKETPLRADIKIGDIKNHKKHNNPVLEVNVSITYGNIRQTTDFLYLQPQRENPMAKFYGGNIANTSTASSQRAQKQNRNANG
jgi:hypothetical protein